MSSVTPWSYDWGVMHRDLATIDYRISRLQALMRRLRAERRVAILRYEQQLMKRTGEPQHIGEIQPQGMNDIKGRGFQEGQR
jgi:hypothetical protein